MKTVIAFVALFAAAGLYANGQALPDYQQCGGLGGTCSQTNSCVDAQWEGSSCQSGSTCTRNTGDHWMCTPRQELWGSATDASIMVEADPLYKIEDTAGVMQPSQSSSEDDSAALQHLDDLLGKPWTGKKTMLPLYQQCGGKGGACSGQGAICADVAWPGYQCEGGECVRNSDYNYQCKPKNEGKATTTTDAEGQASLDVTADGIIPRWKQCGGNTAACKDFGEDACQDCRFPGTSCEEGYTCSRVVEFFWQCAPVDMASPGPKCDTDNAPFAGGQKMIAADQCGSKMSDMEVEGTYMDSLVLDTTTPYHECCSACSSNADCVAFQVNKYGNGTDTCDIFSTFNGFLPATGSIAALLVPQETSLSTAGK